eukprot:1183882-Prorocentrum_minimum.AAC.2
MPELPAASGGFGTRSEPEANDLLAKRSRMMGLTQPVPFNGDNCGCSQVRPEQQAVASMSCARSRAKLRTSLSTPPRAELPCTNASSLAGRLRPPDVANRRTRYTHGHEKNARRLFTSSNPLTFP